MNNFKRNLLIVLIASAVSTYSYGMLPSQDEAEKAETLAREKIAAALSSAAEPVSATATVATQTIPEGARSPLEPILPGQVRPASPTPREKSVLEMTVRHGGSSTISASLPETAITPPATPERCDSPASSSDSDREYVSAAEGKSPRGSKSGSAIKGSGSDAKARPTATTDEFAQARALVKKDASADSKATSREISAEIPAAAGVKKADSSSALPRDPSESLVEDAILNARVAGKAAAATSKELDPAAGTGLSPAPVVVEARPTVTFAQPDPNASAAALAADVQKKSGSVNRDRLVRAAEARREVTPIDVVSGAREDIDSDSASSSSDSASGTLVARSSVASDAAPNPNVNIAAAKPAALQKDSLLKKIKRNKLKTFAIIFALAEAADLTQAYLLKTTQEELQDKTLLQKAKIVAQKTYTAKLLGVAKDTALNLKQHLKTFLHKKNNT